MLFNEETANNLQQIAIFFEVIGFILAAGGLFWPNHIKSIDEFITDLSNIRNLPDAVQFFAENRNIKHPAWILVKVPLVVLCNISALFVGSVLLIATESLLNSIFDVTLTATIYSFIPSLLLFWFIGSGIVVIIAIQIAILALIPIHKFKNLNGGQVVGGFGLILAFFGLCFEVYQVLAIWNSQGCYGL